VHAAHVNFEVIDDLRQKLREKARHPLNLVAAAVLRSPVVGAV